MKKGRVRFENRGLWVLLGALCMIIVGLIVGVIVVNIQSSVSEVAEGGVEHSVGHSVGQTELDASIASGYYAEDELSEEAYTYNYNYLTRMIETGQTDDGKKLSDLNVFFLRMVLARLMIQYNKAEEVMDYLNSIDQSGLSSSELAEIYANYSLAYELMGDQESALKYANMSSDMYENREDGEGA